MFDYSPSLDSFGRLFDDFFAVNTALYTDTNSGGSPPPLSVANALGGWLQAPTKAAQNDYRSVSTPALFELLDERPLTVGARIKVVEAAASSSSWYFGLVDTLTAGFLSTAGAPPSSYKGVVLWKSKNSNMIKFETANGSTKWTLQSVGAFESGAPLQLAINFNPTEFRPGGGGRNGTVRPFVNGQSDDPDGRQLPVQPIAFGDMGPLYLSLGVVAGTAAAETLQVDFLGAEFARK